MAVHGPAASAWLGAAESELQETTNDAPAKHRTALANIVDEPSAKPENSQRPKAHGTASIALRYLSRRRWSLNTSYASSKTSTMSVTALPRSAVAAVSTRLGSNSRRSDV